MQRSKIRLVLFGIVPALMLFVWMRTRGHEIVNSPAGPGPIVAFGDSLTEGFGAEAGHSYPDYLSQLLGREVINHGVSGETAGDALKRLDRDILQIKPAMVLVCLGGNDLLRRIDATKTFASLREIVDRSQATGAVVVIIGVEGLPLISADFDSYYSDLASETGALYIPDVLDGLMDDQSLMSDSIHPNGAGYKKIAERIAEALQPHLE